jgi:hypothetical protein
MPIVFVHGVNNRDGEAYRENEQARSGFLKEIVAPALGMKPNKLQVLNPYWGKYGAQFAWGMAVLPNPSAEFEAFGKDAEAEARGRVAGLLAESHANGNLVDMARKDFRTAIDLLYASAMAAAETEEEARDLAKSYELAIAYAEANPQPAWLADAEPNNFADRLNHAARASDVESFGAGGILDSLKEGVSRLFNAVPDATTEAAGRLLRKKLNATITRFAGDAFVYLNNRGTVDNPSSIVSTVLADLRKASAISKTEGEPLVVIAHILGADAALPVASEEVVAGRQAADDDHVLPAVDRECGRDLGHHGIGRQGRRQWNHEAGLQALLIDSMWRAISDASRV